jgi:RING finger/CHY zinc finger protein 1
MDADVEHQANIRKEIIRLQRDTSLDPRKRQELIFSLFNHNHTPTITPICTPTQHQHQHHHQHQHQHQHQSSFQTSSSTSTTITSTTQTISSPVETREKLKSLLNNLSLSEEKYIDSNSGARIHIPCSQFLQHRNKPQKCAHYDRGCSIYTECCSKFYNCRLCHDAENPDHSLDPKTVKVIRCNYCDLWQVPSNKCVNQQCGKAFGTYHCSICNLWSTGVEIYHCKKCDICLRGKEGIDNKHCDTCGYCMPITRYHNHQCCETDQEICGICREGFIKCLGDIEKTPCGHIFHMSCMEKYIHHDIVCPLCKKTLINMEETWQELDILREQEELPEEYQNWQVRYLCNRM